MRGPEGTPVGKLRRIIISNIVVYNADPRYGSIISGIPGQQIEDVTLSNIKIYARGGGTKEDAALTPPEREDAYPEPSMFGKTPAYGFFIRHAKGLELNNVEVLFEGEDARPAFVLNDVSDVEFNNVEAQTGQGVPVFVLKNVGGFSTHQCRLVADVKLDKVDSKEL